MFQCRGSRAVVSATVAAQARWASLGDSSRLKKQRARAAGTHMGRPPKTTEAQRMVKHGPNLGLPHTRAM